MILGPIYIGDPGSTSANTVAPGYGGGGPGGGYYTDNDKCPPRRGGYGCAIIQVIKFEKTKVCNKILVNTASGDRAICAVPKAVMDKQDLKSEGKAVIKTNAFTKTTAFSNNTIELPIGLNQATLKLGGNYALIDSASNINSDLSINTSKLASKNTSGSLKNIPFVTQAKDSTSTYYAPVGIDEYSIAASTNNTSVYDKIYVSDCIVIATLQAGGGGGGGGDVSNGLFN